MAYARLLSAAIETQVYDTLHQLLGKIAEDYGLNHGEMVEKYLVLGRECSPPPQYIYKNTGDESEGSVNGEDKPKKKREPKRKATKKVKEAKVEDREGKCTATTAKGTLCKNKALGGGCTCRVHTKNADEDEPKEKKKRAKKSKKVEPEHTHKLDELAGSDCELCETHGNPLDGEQEFEVVIEEEEGEILEKPEEEKSEAGDEIDEELEAQIAREIAAAQEDEMYGSESEADECDD